MTKRFPLLLLSCVLIVACSDSSSGGSGPGAGSNSGAGAGSQSGGKSCEDRCEAVADDCGAPAGQCGGICQSISELELGCLESSKCNDGAYQSCVADGSSSGKGGSSSGKGGTGGTGGTGGSSSGKGGTGGTGGTGGSDTGNGCLETDVKDEGGCVNRDTKEGDNVCSSFSTKKNAYACCHVETKNGCTNVGTAPNGVSIHCCP